MSHQLDQPFDSIESAFDFVRILSSAAADAKRDLEEDIQREGKPSRRLEALRLAFYNVDKLEFHVNRSRRILNDLRSLRRLLFEERAVAKAVIATKAVIQVPQSTAVPLHIATSKVARVRAKPRSTVAA